MSMYVVTDPATGEVLETVVEQFADGRHPAVQKPRIAGERLQVERGQLGLQDVGLLAFADAGVDMGILGQLRRPHVHLLRVMPCGAGDSARVSLIISPPAHIANSRGIGGQHILEFLRRNGCVHTFPHVSDVKDKNPVQAGRHRLA